MGRGDDDASAILRRVPSSKQQPQDGVLAPMAANAAGGQRQGWEDDQEDETRSEIGNENFKARAAD